MLIPLVVIPWLNIVLIVFVALLVVNGYFHGLLLQLLDLLGFAVALFVAWLLSPALGQLISLYPGRSSFFDDSTIGNLLYDKVNMVVWFIIIFLSILLLSFLLRPILGLVGKLPIIKQLNHVLGGIFALFTSVFWLLLFCFILSTPLIKNGTEVIANTWLAQFQRESSKVFQLLDEPFKENTTVQKVLNGEPLSADDLTVVTEWLRKNGIDDASIKEFISKLK